VQLIILDTKDCFWASELKTTKILASSLNYLELAILINSFGFTLLKRPEISRKLVQTISPEYEG
jgi:hypothetical protein